MTTASGERRTATGSVIVTERKKHWLFDRPKPPHDWRWVVGWIGKVLIVVGLLMFAFVAYQLWGTGIYTAQAQNRLEDQFRQAGIDATTLPPTTATTTTIAPATTSSTPPVPTGGATTSPATTTTIPAPTGPDTVPYPFAPPEVGSVLARLEIPSIKVDYMIVQGVGVDELAKGPGHFPESALPGQLGNTAIAGHRTTHGAPLYDIDELDPGDTIVITYPPIGGEQGPQFTYVVTGTEIVSPNDYADVVPSTDPTRATLALVSCHPVRSASHRMVVRAELDPARSSTLFAATAPAGSDEPQVLPGDDTESTPVSTAATTSEVPQSVGPTTVAADDRGPGDGAEHARPVVAATGSEPGRLRRRLVRRQLGVAADHPVGPGPPGDLRRRLPAGPTHSTNLAGHARVVRPVRHRLVLLVREHQPAAPAGPVIRTLTFTSRDITPAGGSPVIAVRPNSPAGAMPTGPARR